MSLIAAIERDAFGQFYWHVRHEETGDTLMSGPPVATREMATIGLTVALSVATDQRTTVDDRK